MVRRSMLGTNPRRYRTGKGEPKLKPGEWITAHFKSGDYPAVVTRVNGDGTVSLTAFKPAEIVHADNVMEYKGGLDDVDGDDEARYGTWTRGLVF